MVTGSYDCCTRCHRLQVRSTAVGYLQRSVVAAEKLGIGVDQVQESLMKLVLPMTNDLTKHVATGSKNFEQVRGRDLPRRTICLTHTGRV